MNAGQLPKIAFLIGRIILGGFYLYYAFDQFTQLNFWAGYAGSKGVPMPELAVIGAGLLLAVGGLSLITGIRPDIGVGALALFLIPVTLITHNFWAMQGLDRIIELASFLKNVGLLSSALMFLVIPQPWAYSLNNWFGALSLGRKRTVSVQ